MTQFAQNSEASLSEELRQRFAADLAAGRTIALPAADLARADLRAHLPEVLESLMSPTSEATRLQIPNYTVLGEIGHGGMSTVYLASHNKLRRYVALKIVPNWLGGQDRARERMLKEAQAMARVAHPNIVTIHDIIDTGDTVAIAMEWIDGLTLAGLLRSLPEQATPDDMAILRTSLGTPQGTPDQLETTTTRTFVRMMADIARAVHCVHQNNLLHLDIKPSNVLVRRNGTPLLADFGVVREMDLALTHTRSFAGTPIYAAPEQLRREDASFGPRTDVYGLGITLYELIARIQPLRQESLTKVLQDIQTGRIPPLSNHAEVPQDLENIVHKAISPELSKRYASALELACDLQAFLDGRPVAARPLSRAERIARWARAEPWKAMLAVILSITLPTVTVLGAKLWLDQPIKAAQLRDEMQKRHDAYVHEGFQSYLVTTDIKDDHLQNLREALAEDPANEDVLACLLTLEAAASPGKAIQRIQSLGNRQTPGTKLLSKRLEEARLYFDAEETQQLRASSSRIDRLFLILDEMLRGQQAGDSACFHDAAADIETANSKDPLIQGLRIWAAAQNGDKDKLSQSIYHITQLWSNDLYSHAWAMFALERQDAPRARQVIEHFLSNNPGNLGALTLLAQSHLLSNQAEEALKTLARPSRPDPHWEESAQGTKIRSLGALGRIEEARKLLPKPIEELLKNLFWLETLASIEPDQVKQTYLKLAQDAQATMATLLGALRFAQERNDVPMIRLVAERGNQRFPQHPTFAWTMVRLCLQDNRDYQKALTYVGDTPPPQYLEGTVYWIAAQLRLYDKKWSLLPEICRRWQKGCPDDLRHEHYLGLALNRLGRHAEALPHLNRYLGIGAVPSPGGNIAPKYQDAYAELGWCLLAEAPKNQPQAHDELLRECVEEMSPGVRRKAWLSLVAAELEGALGNRREALRLGRQAKELLKPNEFGAPANIAQMIDDAIARFQ
ncbi:MAG: protein kinase [Planctomycetes bacterium]|nr:protein kinase [Planctomycetota bacterium]